MRLGELAGRLVGERRRRRRPAGRAPREIVPPRPAAPARADAFDAARERLRARIPPRRDED